MPTDSLYQKALINTFHNFYSCDDEINGINDHQDRKNQFPSSGNCGTLKQQWKTKRTQYKEKEQDYRNCSMIPFYIFFFVHRRLETDHCKLRVLIAKGISFFTGCSYINKRPCFLVDTKFNPSSPPSFSIHYRCTQARDFSRSSNPLSLHRLPSLRVPVTSPNLPA